MSYRTWKKYEQHLSDDEKRWLLYLAVKDFLSTATYKANRISPEKADTPKNTSSTK